MLMVKIIKPDHTDWLQQDAGMNINLQGYWTNIVDVFVGVEVPALNLEWKNGEAALQINTNAGQRCWVPFCLLRFVRNDHVDG